ncbi:unnamed protein product [Arctia plantaginis]|uniref:Daxx histone-binding domain-containing protein n=1 Tax=Arctia plantaginis TaxID=874455 RepID=A0A8S1B5H6_ARCPL|nr:unnamed protein product [Arctia plantaginis]
MSSEDVIELGSSDEETEPARKRSKPMPNAMVCIPRKFHDVTITPAKPNPIAIAKGLGKAITVKKVVNSKPSNVTKSRPNNGMPVQTLKQKHSVNPVAERKKTVIVPIKPNLNLIPVLRPGNPIPTHIKPPPFLQNPLKIQQSGPLNLLPSSITVKKTMSNRTIVMLNNKKKQETKQRHVGEVLTVELDDDEAPARRSSPQWYVRPEDQVLSSTEEEKNNKEPDTSKLIEITIEDSPAKPIIHKQTHTVGAELAITIDDSPVKVIVDKDRSASESDNENDNNVSQTPRSKKQLVYPKDTENNKTVEIEIEPHSVSVNNCTDSKDPKDDSFVSREEANKQNLNYMAKSEGINKSADKETDSSLSKESIKDAQNSDLSEFHPVYQSFIDLCFQLENSDDMKTIVEKKIKGYYKQVPKDYTESEEFTDMVSSKILAMKAGPEKMYLYIKDVVDELNLQRKLAKAQPVKEIKNEEAIQVCGEENEYDSKRQRQVRKLEKTIKKLHRAIQKLEEQEVDFDDEDDSVYLLTERYKERMVRVYAKFCQLSNTKMPSEPRIQLDSRPGQPPGPAKRLEKWINKKVPIGTPLPFPDFHDVLRCVREANEEDRLNYNEADIMEEARDLFTRCGKKLQRRRQENEWRLAVSRIALDIDPAEKNEDLKRKLNENQKVAAQKETEIFNKYADRQNQLKLVGEEIGDKEAEESPVESEEEEANDDNASLENTEKRKERLKRLLQEKSKKTAEEKNSQSSNEEQKNINDETIRTTAEVENISKAEPNLKEIEKKDEEDIRENKEDSNHEPSQATETLTLSDDSKDLESDIDELHLLQKLHSGNEDLSSSIDSSDSDSPIAISDSLESSDNGKKSADDDVISIENSSYSENESDKVEDSQMMGNVQYLNEDSTPSQEAEITSIVDENAMEVDLNSDKDEQAVIKAPFQTKNAECDEAVENILLASSEDSNNCDSQEEITGSVCVNLRDDLISIDETVVGNATNDSVIKTEKVHITAGLLVTSSEEIERENNTFEENIDSNVRSANNTVLNKKATGLNNKSLPDTVQTAGHVLAEVQKNTVESMNVDEDSVINESNILHSPEQDISAISNLKES